MILLMLACKANDPITQENAEWNENQMWAAFDALIEIGLPNVHEAFEQYQMLYDEGGTLDCPGDGYNFNSSDVQDNGCTAENDFFFNGAAEVRYEQGGWSFGCDCRIDAPDGRKFEGAGNIVQYNSGQGDSEETFYDIRGTFLSNFGPEWLQMRPSSVISIYDGDIFQIEGGYTLDGTSVYFNQMNFDTCEYGTGRLDVRDPSGGWWYFERSNQCNDQGTLFYNGKVVSKNHSKDLRPLYDAVLLAIQEVTP